MIKIKAWAFLAKDNNGSYFITDESRQSLVFFKKPKSRGNPFDYKGKIKKWKPTEIEIIIKK